MIETLFQENKVKCIKFNYSLDEVVQKHVCFDAFIKLSQDKKQLIIANKKPVEDDYILEADPNEVRRLQIQQELMLSQKKKSKDEPEEFNEWADFNRDRNGFEDEKILKQITQNNKNRRYHIK